MPFTKSELILLREAVQFRLKELRPIKLPHMELLVNKLRNLEEKIT